MENRTLIQIAKLISTLFMPLYAPLWVFIGLFLFSYLSLLPWSYKLFVLILVYLFTILIPTSGISIFRTFKKWTHCADYLHHYQCVVESEHPHGWHRRIGGGFECFQHLVPLQPCVAFLHIAIDFRSFGFKPHHFAPAQPGTSFGWFWYRICVCNDIHPHRVDVKKIENNKR